MAKRKKNQVTQQELMERLVDNALDFLTRAIDEFQDSPKYSVIHFSAAVEQFLKARLMAEHWSLVVSDRQPADWDKFTSGNFQSVTLAEAASKLDKVVRSGLSADALAAFSTVANHRNRAIHFFHSAHTDKEAQSELRRIAKEQLVAWFHLHRLLQNRWSDTFGPWLENIDSIEEKLRSYRDFLSMVFDEVTPELQRYRDAGALVEACAACSFESMVFANELNVIDTATCLVCGHAFRCITIECPSCEEQVRFEGEGFATCEHCNTSFEPEHIADAIEDEGAAYEAAKEGDAVRGNCGDCDGYHSVVRVPSGQWVATCCLVEHERLETCEWCNEPNTGDMEMSYHSGCNMCDGHAGWTKGD